MKRVIMPLACALVIVSAVSCGGSNNSEDTTTDSLSTTTTTTEESTNESTSTSGTTEGTGAKRKFVDLSTGSEVELEKDTKTGYYTNITTHRPVDLFIDTETRDTFDMRGRNVGMALIRDNAGHYSVNESKVKLQSDNDLIIKDTENDTKIKLEPDGETKVKTEDYKEKLTDDKYKYKDDSMKVKVKDGQMKVKPRGQ